MAIIWGNWDYSGGNGMRVGVDVSVPTPGHGWVSITVSVDYWTQNQFNYSDPQTLHKTNAITGTVNYTNNGGSGTQTKRNTDSFTYTFAGGDYGPGNATTRTIGASVTGTYNGSSPSVSVNVDIPNRPYGSPAAPNTPSATRNSDTNISLNWTRNATSGEPYSSQTIQRQRMATGFSWVNIATVGSGATSYTDGGSDANRSYTYRIQASNSIGDSGWSSASNQIYNTPAGPDDPASLTDLGGGSLKVDWVNHCDYDDYNTEIWRAVNGTWGGSAIHTSNNGVTTWTDTTATSSTSKYKYRLRAFNTLGIRKNSDYAFTPETLGTTSAPSAPTDMSPTGTVDGTEALTFTWTHNPTDGSAQTKYTLQHRVVGSGTWTTVTNTSAISQYVLPPGTYSTATDVEWHVLTYGASTTAGPYSSTVTFTTMDPTAIARYPVYLNTVTGMLEADSTGTGFTPSAGMSYTFEPPGTGLMAAQLSTTIPDGIITVDAIPAEDVTTVLIANIDADGIARTPDLLACGPGSYIYAQKPGDPSTFGNWMVTADPIQIINGVQYSVTLTAQGTNRLPPGTQVLEIVLTPAAGGAPAGPASGDLTGTYPSPQINGVTVTIVTASNLWSIPHNLGKQYVMVVTTDPGGTEMYGEVRYIDANNCQVSWYNPMTGVARVSA